ncbi:hypothetical protein JEQ04_13315 [Serratia plymuthica]|uniref:hypothetical protein n=1 Tax=Serratia plymuthica TaxID=82996 RepID=UPI0018E434DE|nr:hypothetical protein [Serratia plymuthica]MBI6138829.1 hypothetical protein [Serratia plymuthica]
MANNNIRIEIDPRALSPEEFDAIKGDVIKDILSQELTSDGTNLWHVKAEHNKHAKVKIDINGDYAPDDFDELAIGDRLERIDVVLKDI